MSILINLNNSKICLPQVYSVKSVGIISGPIWRDHFRSMIILHTTMQSCYGNVMGSWDIFGSEDRSVTVRLISVTYINGVFQIMLHVF